MEMKRILIIEDDDTKATAVESLVSDTLIGPCLSRAHSYQSGVKSLLDGVFDLILLDMTMPTFDVGKNEPGGKPQPFAGRNVLDQIARHDITTKVVVITQFETFGVGRQFVDIIGLDERLKLAYPRVYEGIIYYHAAQSQWRADLQQKLVSLVGLE